MSSSGGDGKLIVVSGLFGHGTTYYTNYLQRQGYLARHEYVYNGKHVVREPAEGQTHEVSGWSFPYETDVLLVRDPRRALHSLAKHNPHYHEWTHKHFGYHPHTLKLLQRSWVDWYTLGLSRDPEILRIEDVPKLHGVKANKTKRGHKRPYTWDELAPDLVDLCYTLGYDTQHGT